MLPAQKIVRFRPGRVSSGRDQPTEVDRILIILIAVPALLLGFAPLIVSAWLAKFTRSLVNVSGDALPVMLLTLVVAVG